ncbi:MAG: hypothetical protein IKJ27_07860 [Clostridia bacterium]|nr:hypothetical protein [Clostridia bacterium]
MSVKANGIYVLENKFISKVLNIEKGKIVLSSNENRLSGSKLTRKSNCTEFRLGFGKGFFSKKLSSEALTVTDAQLVKNAGKEILTLSFAEARISGCGVKIGLVYELGENDPFIRKYVTLSPGSNGVGDVFLDSIELENMSFSAGLVSWTLPMQQNSHISGFLMSVGQPVYVDSFYFGCEFPVTYNRIAGRRVIITSYIGKKLSQLADDGVYKSHKAVFGVSENNTFATVQKAFYSYIRSISKPVKLRIQYNSWYDNMLNINVENITESFLSIDKGLSNYGTKVPDSYVMDDGWNDYAADFWKFNAKFPNGLAEFRDLSENLGSRFGLWLGPRGGYTKDTIKFARNIEKGGNGYVNKNAVDICVGSKKYVDRTADMLLGFAKNYNLNYFKLDGFAQRACRDKSHDHLTGGFENMYFFSDVWEKWIAFFERVYDFDESFWINLTSYAPPSPWFLQWCNSLWMQISNDHGMDGEKSCDKDRLLTYRDSRYYDFYNIRQFQVPQFALYNHDPIYGKDAKIKMTDDEFREYLFTMAMRGTCFWELYYSHTMFNTAKWRINRSVLAFIEDNMDILSNSVIFGTDPVKGGVYGYSCFGADEGIVCLRNSTSGKKSYTLVLDEKIGAERELKNAKATLMIPYTLTQDERKYNYGDEITVELDGFETRIYHFNKKLKLMEPEHIKATDKRTLEVSFNQFVDYRHIECKENEVLEVELLEDYMTVKISFKEKLDRLNRYTLTGVCDMLGNSTDVELEFDYCKDYEVREGVFGKYDFTLRTESAEKNTVLYTQGEELSLSVDCDGYVHFVTGNDELISRTPVSEKESITAVRERNGVMKIYLGKKLDSGRNSIPAFLSGKEADFDSKTVKAYNRALAFDEV